MKNITVDVRIFANLRDYTGFKDIQMEVPSGITIRDLLTRISEKAANPAGFLMEILEPETNEVKPYFKVLIHGKILMPDEILGTTVEKDNIVIAIFPPVGGG